MLRRTSVVIAALAITFVFFVPAGTAQELPDRGDRASVPDHVADLMLDRPASASALDADLRGATGAQTVLVRLAGDSVAESSATTGATRKARKSAVEAEQRDFVDRARRAAPDARVVADTQVVLNAVVLEVDASALATLAADPAVLRISKVHDYELDLSETVPYIGATAVQNRGYDGSGIKVAVLDSGIDYTHAALGGSGDPADYAGNDPTIIEPGTFPTAKVVGGYDFVGSNWSGGAGTPPEVPDPDPLDDGPEAGHGTHVARIIGGDGGVAPGVDLTR
jgi:subtilisin family serine protease